MKKRILVVFTVLAMMAAMISGNILTVSAANSSDLQVALVADSKSVAAGDEIKINLTFPNADGLDKGISSMISILSFDSSAVDFVSVEFDGDFGKDTYTTSALFKGTSDTPTGEVKTAFTYFDQSKDGFKKTTPFATYTFKVKSSASGKAQFKVNFDEIITSVYSDSTVKNYSVNYKKPFSASVDVSGTKAANSDFGTAVSGGVVVKAEEMPIAASSGFEALSQALADSTGVGEKVTVPDNDDNKNQDSGSSSMWRIEFGEYYIELPVWAWILIGVGIVAVIAAIVVVIIVLVKKKKKKAALAAYADQTEIPAETAAEESAATEETLPTEDDNTANSEENKE